MLPGRRRRCGGGRRGRRPLAAGGGPGRARRIGHGARLRGGRLSGTTRRRGWSCRYRRRLRRPRSPPLRRLLRPTMRRAQRARFLVRRSRPRLAAEAAGLARCRHLRPRGRDCGVPLFQRSVALRGLQPTAFGPARTRPELMLAARTPGWPASRHAAWSRRRDRQPGPARLGRTRRRGPRRRPLRRRRVVGPGSRRRRRPRVRPRPRHLPRQVAVGLGRGRGRHRPPPSPPRCVRHRGHLPRLPSGLRARLRRASRRQVRTPRRFEGCGPPPMHHGGGIPTRRPGLQGERADRRPRGHLRCDRQTPVRPGRAPTASTACAPCGYRDRVRRCPRLSTPRATARARTHSRVRLTFLRVTSGHATGRGRGWRRR